MRVSKRQIVNGIVDYMQGEILPKMGNDKAMQIILSIGVNAIKVNNRLIDTVLENEIVRAMLQDDGTGTYEVGGIVDAMRAAIEQYGSFPVQVPAIPLISPHEITLRLDAEDVDAMKRRIESAI